MSLSEEQKLKLLNLWSFMYIAYCFDQIESSRRLKDLPRTIYQGYRFKTFCFEVFFGKLKHKLHLFSMRPSFRNRDTMHPKPSVDKWTFHRFIHSQKQIISKERKLVGVAFLSMLSLFPIGSFLPKRTFPNGSLGIFFMEKGLQIEFHVHFSSNE